MKRRDFIGLLGAIALASPVAARAQHAKPVIGFLHSADPTSFAPQLAAFHDGLRDGGFEEGRNLAIEYRWAEGHPDRLPALADDLVRHKVELIAAVGGNASNLAAKGATQTIPIVFGSGSDPVKLGLIPSLGRPGGNITGFTFFFADLVAKQLDLLYQVVPTAKTVAVLIDPSSAELRRQPEQAREAALKLGVEIKVVGASNDAELDRGFGELAALAADALIVAGNPFFGRRMQRVVDLAAQHRLPAMFYRREYVARGGFMSYGTSLNEAYRQVGIYATKILKGAKPGDLPVAQSTKFDFAVNLKTAKSLGIEFNPQLLATANEVIE